MSHLHHEKSLRRRPPSSFRPRQVGHPFEAATRDLFRHIHDSAHLKRNPLVSQFFDNASDRHSEHVAVTSIRTRILEIARTTFETDTAEGRSDLARRQFAIAEALCAKERPTAIADRLGLSRSQFYRDRQIVARRIAAELQLQDASRGALTEGPYEPLRLFIQRAVAMIGQGFAHKAIEEFYGLLKVTATNKSAQGQLLMRLCDAWIALGDTSRASEYLLASRQLIANTRLPEQEEARLRDLDQLMQGRLARAAGTYDEARQTLGAVVARGINEPLMDPQSEEVLLEIAVEACVAAYESRRQEEARRYLQQAADLGARVATIPMNLRVQLEIAAGYTSDPASQLDAYWRYRKALELALAGGSAEGAVLASHLLAFHFARRRDSQRAYEYCLRAIEIARAIEGKDTFATAVVYAGHILVGTRFWRALGPQLFDVEMFCRPGTPRWVRLKDAQGVVLAKAGRPIDAMAALAAAENCAWTPEDRVDRVRRLRHLSSMSARLGRQQDAARYADAARDVSGAAEPI
jgi:tetratricopeptide (TPR) repeat protein